MARIAAIADDYTGASDLANTWRRNGLGTVQAIGVPEGLDVSGADAVVVSLKIRSVPAPEAVAAALQAYDWLKRAGADHVMYKVCSTFDSTDEGNIGQVTDALRGKAGAAWTLVTPAFPATGRTVYQGHLFVGSQLLSESPLRYHPLNPMHDPDLARVLARQSEHAVGLLDLATVRAGDVAARERVAELVRGGARSVIADSVSEDDLERLGPLALSVPVSTGASGLGLGLARAARSGRPAADGDGDEATAGGHAAVVAGSCSARTLEQIERAGRTMPVLFLDPDRLVSEGGDVSAALAWARKRLPGGPVLIAASSDPGTVRAVQARHGRERASQVIEAASAELARGLVEAGVRRLVVAGGETAGAVVDRLGVRGFRIGGEIAPGVPALRTMGREGGELAMALKSGNFGGPDFFGEAIARL